MGTSVSSSRNPGAGSSQSALARSAVPCGEAKDLGVGLGNKIPRHRWNRSGRRGLSGVTARVRCRMLALFDLRTMPPRVADSTQNDI